MPPTVAETRAAGVRKTRAAKAKRNKMFNFRGITGTMRRTGPAPFRAAGARREFRAGKFVRTER